MKRLLAIIFSFFVSCNLLAQGVPDCTLKDARVEKYIAAKVKEFDGHEYCQYRRYETFYDLDGDKKEDFIVLFTVESIHQSANAFVQFIAEFLSTRMNKPPLEIQVGERCHYMASSFMVTDTLVVLPTLVWKVSDALCCPSDTSEQRLFILNGKLEKLWSVAPNQALKLTK